MFPSRSGLKEFLYYFYNVKVIINSFNSSISENEILLSFPKNFFADIEF